MCGMNDCELPARDGGTNNNEMAETASIRGTMTLCERTKRPR